MWLEMKIRSIFESKRKRKAAGGNTYLRHSKADYREIEMPRVILHLGSRKKIPASTF